MGRRQRNRGRKSRAKPIPRRDRPYGLMVLGALVLLLGVLFVFRLTARAPAREPVAATVGQPVPAALLAALRIAAHEGFTTTAGAVPPLRFHGPLWQEGRRPVVFYAGADYCPFCAAERWVILLALLRFGTFSGLRLMRSSPVDVYADTPTFTFDGVRYTSPNVVFRPVELFGRTPLNGQYPLLERPTATELRELDTFDRPPYAEAAGEIPVVDVANRYGWISASYDPSLLDGKTWSTIASLLEHGHGGSLVDAIQSNVNELTATICAVDGGRPKDVRAVPALQRLEAALPGA